MRISSFGVGILRGSIAAALLVAACSAPTDATIAQVSVRGTWSYASNESGRATSASGTLVLSQDSTVQFSGTLDANETDDRGLLHRILAVVSGRTIDATLVDFDVVLDPTVTRRHTGSARGDSLTGNWVELSPTGIAASGTFRAHRVRTP
ncbi:MAG TPA: hypothetical protein VF785_14020 [Gemmatimonadaceae bacterium]